MNHRKRRRILSPAQGMSYNYTDAELTVYLTDEGEPDRICKLVLDLDGARQLQAQLTVVIERAEAHHANRPQATS